MLYQLPLAVAMVVVSVLLFWVHHKYVSPKEGAERFALVSWFFLRGLLASAFFLAISWLSFLLLDVAFNTPAPLAWVLGPVLFVLSLASAILSMVLSGYALKRILLRLHRRWVFYRAFKVRAPKSISETESRKELVRRALADLAVYLQAHFDSKRKLRANGVYTPAEVKNQDRQARILEGDIERAKANFWRAHDIAVRFHLAPAGCSRSGGCSYRDHLPA